MDLKLKLSVLFAEWTMTLFNGFIDIQATFMTVILECNMGNLKKC